MIIDSAKCQERAFFQTLASFARAHLLWIGVRLELEHAERRRWVEEIADINRKLAEMAQSL